VNHYAASHRKTGVASILDDTGALVAEHQRRLGSRVSTRQDRARRRRPASLPVAYLTAQITLTLAGFKPGE